MAETGWVMWMVCHFHYDPVWWSTQGQFLQTRLLLPDEHGEMTEVRTAFELVRLHLDAARRDPDYKFVLAELDYLKPHFDAHPEDRADLLRFIQAGRIELVGGNYNEPNTNLTGVESTIRNAVYGLAYQRDVLGGDPSTAWMLDAFGFDPGYPGLMAAAGLTESSWARGPFHQWGPNRSAGGNELMQFASEFEWLSPDGSGLLTSYMANHYSAGWLAGHHAKTLDAAMADAYRQFRELAPVAATRNVMLPVGGDHVIPPRWATPIQREWNSRYVWPRFQTAVPSEFFAAVRAGRSRTRPLDHAADPGHEPGLHRQGRHLHRHQARPARSRGSRARRRAAGHARVAGRGQLSGREPRQGVAPARVRRPPRRDHRHRGRPGLPGSAGRLARGVGTGRPGSQRRHPALVRAGRHGQSGGRGRAGLAVVVVNSLSFARTAMATVRLELPVGLARLARAADDTGVRSRSWPRASAAPTPAARPR